MFCCDFVSFLSWVKTEKYGGPKYAKKKQRKEKRIYYTYLFCYSEYVNKYTYVS